MPGFRLRGSDLTLPALSSSLQLLSKPKFNVVEKIKTIGTTYMAAAGLTNPTTGEERKVRKYGKVCPLMITTLMQIKCHIIPFCCHSNFACNGWNVIHRQAVFIFTVGVVLKFVHQEYF